MENYSALNFLAAIGIVVGSALLVEGANYHMVYKHEDYKKLVKDANDS